MKKQKETAADCADMVLSLSLSLFPSPPLFLSLFLSLYLFLPFLSPSSPSLSVPKLSGTAELRRLASFSLGAIGCVFIGSPMMLFNVSAH